MSTYGTSSSSSSYTPASYTRPYTPAGSAGYSTASSGSANDKPPAYDEGTHSDIAGKLKTGALLGAAIGIAAFFLTGGRKG
jgi:hypothetical protein